MEASFHAWIYKNSNYEVIAHTHPTNTLKILCSIWGSRFAEERLFPDQVVFNGATSCLVPYATPGNDLTKVIKNAASDFLDLYKEFPSLFLLENHGIICCANSVQRTLTMTQICEKAAEIFVGSKRLGSQNCLARTEVFAIAQHEDEVYRKELQ
jgi:ribulose-5-phosphate 4-epimerase/fuculose-1-phosphate aldolase